MIKFLGFYLLTIQIISKYIEFNFYSKLALEINFNILYINKILLI